MTEAAIEKVSIPMFSEPPSTLNRAEFQRVYGEIYENAPWISECVWEQTFGMGINDIHSLHERFVAVVEGAEERERIDLIRGHPELADRVALKEGLTSASQSEQEGAGLDNCSEAEFGKFRSLNAQYRTKFDFPFVIAVKGRSRNEILDVLEHRLMNERQAEIEGAIRQIHRIAYLRLIELRTEPRHVL